MEVGPSASPSRRRDGHCSHIGKGRRTDGGGGAQRGHARRTQLKHQQNTCSPKPRTYEVNFLEILFLQYDLLIEKLHLPAMDRALYETLFLFKLRNYISSSDVNRRVPQPELRRDSRIGPLIGGLELVLHHLKKHFKNTMHALQSVDKREDVVNRLFACCHFYDEGHCVEDDAKISFLLLLQEHQRRTVEVVQRIKKWQTSFQCSPQVFAWWNGESYMDRLKQDLFALQRCSVGRLLGLHFLEYPCHSNVQLQRLIHRKELMRIARLVSTHSVMKQGMEPFMCPEASEYFDEHNGGGGGGGGPPGCTRDDSSGRKKGSRWEENRGEYRCTSAAMTTAAPRGGGSGGGGRRRSRRIEEGPEDRRPGSQGGRGAAASVAARSSPYLCGPAGQWRRKQPHPRPHLDDGDSDHREGVVAEHSPTRSEGGASASHEGDRRLGSRGASHSSKSRGVGIGGQDKKEKWRDPLVQMSSSQPRLPISGGGDDESALQAYEQQQQELMAAEEYILTFDAQLTASFRTLLRLGEDKKMFLPLLDIPLLCVPSTAEGVPRGAVPLDADMWGDVLNVSHCASFAKSGKTPEALPGTSPSQREGRGKGKNQKGKETRQSNGEGGEDVLEEEEEGDVNEREICRKSSSRSSRSSRSSGSSRN